MRAEPVIGVIRPGLEAARLDDDELVAERILNGCSALLGERGHLGLLRQGFIAVGPVRTDVGHELGAIWGATAVRSALF